MYYKETSKKYYQEHKTQIQQYRLEHKTQKQQYYKQYSLKHKQEYEQLIMPLKKQCTKCGYNKHPEIIHLHHPDKTKKTMELTLSAFPRNKEKQQQYYQEAKPCVALCPTCHMELHHEQKQKHTPQVKTP